MFSWGFAELKLPMVPQWQELILCPIQLPSWDWEIKGRKPKGWEWALGNAWESFSNGSSFISLHFTQRMVTQPLCWLPEGFCLCDTIQVEHSLGLKGGAWSAPTACLFFPSWEDGEGGCIDKCFPQYLGSSWHWYGSTPALSFSPTSYLC